MSTPTENFSLDSKSYFKNSLLDSYDENTQNAVFEMLNFMKVIIANNNEDQFQYLIKWIANTLQEKKNDVCLYLKGEQKIGKSTLLKFLTDYVIVNRLCLQTDIKLLKNNFNAILGGKRLVVFEELETLSAYEWRTISSVLKSYITGKKYVLESPYKVPHEIKNINNYIITTGCDYVRDEIKGSRRFFVLDVSNNLKNNTNYFYNLQKECFNNNVGEAFYNTMISLDIDGFVPQDLSITNP